MIQDIERFWDEFKDLDNVDVLLDRVREKRHEIQTKEDLYKLSIPEMLDILFDYLKKYFDNPDFIKELKIIENVEKLDDFTPTEVIMTLKGFLPDELFFKLCDYYSEKTDIKFIDMPIESDMDIDYLLSKKMTIEDLVKNNSGMYLDEKLKNLSFLLDYIDKKGIDSTEIIEVINKKFSNIHSYSDYTDTSLYMDVIFKLLKKNDLDILKSIPHAIELLSDWESKEAKEKITADFGNTFYQKILDSNFDISILSRKIPNVVKMTNLDLARKMVEKYGVSALHYIKAEIITYEFIKSFPNLNIDFNTYISTYQLASIEELFLKFFKEDPIKVAKYANFTSFSPEAIKVLVDYLKTCSKEQLEEIVKENRRILKIKNSELSHFLFDKEIDIYSTFTGNIQYYLERGLYKELKELLENYKYYSSSIFNIDISFEQFEEIMGYDKELALFLINKVPQKLKIELVKKNLSMVNYINNFTDFENEPSFSKKIPWSILSIYKHDKKELIENYDLIEAFLRQNNIDINKFMQYVFGNNTDWCSSIIFIVKNNLIDSFMKFKEMFLKNKEMNVLGLLNLVSLMDNFSKYPDLCMDIINLGRELTPEETKEIEFLFNRSEKIEGELIPKKISDCNNIIQLFMDKYKKESESSLELDSMKNLVCRLLFNRELEQLKLFLNKYGNTESLRLMIFNDRSDKKIEIKIREMMVYTSMIEDIIQISDYEQLKLLFDNLMSNFELTSTVSTYFLNIEDYMRDLYEQEAISTLTTLDERGKESTKDQESSKKYGIDVYDFRDRKYVLFSHVISPMETVEEVVHGIPQEGHNYISFGPISNRNLVLYNSGGIIFLYDNIPKGSFVISSTSNMGTNRMVSKNSTEITNDSHIEQRGIIEESMAPKGWNAEFMCYREGTKPFAIALPGGREPTSEELEIAEKYGLCFIKTQEYDKSVENPKDIPTKKDEVVSETERIEQLKGLKERLFKVKDNRPRRIAIFTDAHGTFEPTLAILEDARRQGITEIYSLGDNVGSGPNPSEVMDLLEEYGVKSVQGNHEKYALEGTKPFEEHLEKTGALEEAKRNSAWTRDQLTEEQKERMRAFPEYIEVEIGGRKVVLCHYICDYNNGEQVINTDDFDDVFQGHEHFAKSTGNVTTIRGAGIGQDRDSRPNAYYIVLEEQPEGGFKVITKPINYSSRNLGYSIDESGLDTQDADKIKGWAHVR